MQGINLCATTVLEGFYAQAASILRQEMETIEAIKEYVGGTRRDRRTPKLHHFSGMGDVYGMLSEYAHSSVSSNIRRLVDIGDAEVRAPAIVPVYDEHIAKVFFGCHVHFVLIAMLEQARLCEQLFDDQLVPAERTAIVFVGDLLVKEGIVEFRAEQA